jgi:hypothetical protein
MRDITASVVGEALIVGELQLELGRCGIAEQLAILRRIGWHESVSEGPATSVGAATVIDVARIVSEDDRLRGQSVR